MSHVRVLAAVCWLGWSLFPDLVVAQGEPRTGRAEARPAKPDVAGAIHLTGVVQVQWEARGVSHVCRIEMRGQEGTASVRFGGESASYTVYLKRAPENPGYDFFLVGANPSRPDYLPDTFGVSLVDGRAVIAGTCNGEVCNVLAEHEGFFAATGILTGVRPGAGQRPQGAPDTSLSVVGLAGSVEVHWVAGDVRYGSLLVMRGAQGVATVFQGTAADAVHHDLLFRPAPPHSRYDFILIGTNASDPRYRPDSFGAKWIEGRVMVVDTCDGQVCSALTQPTGAFVPLHAGTP